MEEFVYTQAILEKAGKDPKFRSAVVRLGHLADRVSGRPFPDTNLFAEFTLMAIGTAVSSGLIQKGEDPSRIDSIVKWLHQAAPELAYIVSGVERFPSNPRHTNPVGRVFLSWSVKSRRDREAIIGIKAALDWYRVDYFDYMEHQVGEEEDTSAEIERQLRREISEAVLTIEVYSQELIGRPWVDFERNIIRDLTDCKRVFLHLDAGDAKNLRQIPAQEQRIFRIDLSDGKLPGSRVSNVFQKENPIDDFYWSEAYLDKCYDVGSHTRWELDPLCDFSFRRRLTHYGRMMMLTYERDRRRFLRLWRQDKSVEPRSRTQP